MKDPVDERFLMSITPWADTWRVLRLELPLWLVLAASVFIAALSLMDCAPLTQVPLWLRPAFCLYGLGHLVWIGCRMRHGGAPGVGYLLVLLSFLVIAIALVRDFCEERRVRRAAPAAPSPEPSRLPRTEAGSPDLRDAERNR